MSDVEFSLTWRELLGSIIQDVREKQRIALELGVTTVTLSRWVNNTSTPRLYHLRRLLKVLPRYRSKMYELILHEFSDFTMAPDSGLPDDGENEIPAEFYARVLGVYAMTPLFQRSWSITNLILQDAIKRLDPGLVGMAIALVQCMPPSLEGKVCSLRERGGYGTPPWNIDLEPHAIFLGSESLAGYVVSTSHPMIIQNRDEEQGVLPAHWMEWENSVAAYPIFRADKIAGCLVVSCIEPNYFIASRQELIQHYAELLVLAFEAHEFYDLQQIRLHDMPHHQLQEEYLANFRQRVSDLMTSELRNERFVDLRQAELLVWQQVERELLQMAVSAGRQHAQALEETTDLLDGSIEFQ